MQPDQLINNPLNPQNLNHFAFELGNPLRYTDPTGMWTVQVGGTGSAGVVVGGQIGLGGAWDGNGGKSGYDYLGGGVTIGESAGGGIEITYSNNDFVDELSGDTLSIGGSIWIFGFEVNKPLTGKAKSSYSFSIGASCCTPEFHEHYVRTEINSFPVTYSTREMHYGQIYANYAQTATISTFNLISSSQIQSSYAKSISSSRSSGYANKYGYSDSEARRKLAKRDAYFAKKASSK